MGATAPPAPLQVPASLDARLDRLCLHKRQNMLVQKLFNGQFDCGSIQ